MTVCPPGFLFSFSSFLYADRLGHAGLSAGLPFLVQLDREHRSPEDCLSVRRASFFVLHVVPVPFDSTHVSFQVSFVVFQKITSLVIHRREGMFMCCVLHANEAHNFFNMWWCLTEDGLQRITRSRGETNSSMTDDGSDDGRSH